MATATARTATILGVDAHIIEVEADASIGLAKFNIVGLPDGAIRESCDRIQAALNNVTGGLPVRRLVVNLAPADLPKMGTSFDLPIAMALLEAFKIIPENSLKDILMVGELSLEGNIRPINGILAITLAAKQAGFTRIIVPELNKAGASMVEGIEILTAQNLGQVINHFTETQFLDQFSSSDTEPIPPAVFDMDFSDVRGQESAKRTLAISAAGKHNVLFTGPPGSGKSMLAKRMFTILPPMTFAECLESTKIHSIAGALAKDTQCLKARPFQSPHHSVSSAGLVGGGSFPKPGQVSLAHHGVLFLDELTEFTRSLLDLLRQPLEDRWNTPPRAKSSLSFPADFILIAAMNPCPCGYFGDSHKECRCSMTTILKYRSRISGPLMDRIDIQIEMPSLSYDEMNFSKKGETSETIRTRVTQAREVQLRRFNGLKTQYNSNMGHKEVEQYCTLDKQGHLLLEQALKKFRLSGRGHDSILKVSRTIADLENSEMIQPHHLAEAINYRCMDREVSF